jgi:hypothetical protein
VLLYSLFGRRKIIEMLLNVRRKHRARRSSIEHSLSQRQ